MIVVFVESVLERTCAFQCQVTEAPVVLICCGESPMASGQAVPTETLRDRRVNQPDCLESVIALDQVTGATMDGFAECM